MPYVPISPHWAEQAETMHLVSRLRRHTRCPPSLLAIIPVRLWALVARSYPDGRLGDVDHDALARTIAADTGIEAEALWEALTAAPAPLLAQDPSTGDWCAVGWAARRPAPPARVLPVPPAGSLPEEPRADWHSTPMSDIERDAWHHAEGLGYRADLDADLPQRQTATVSVVPATPTTPPHRGARPGAPGDPKNSTPVDVRRPPQPRTLTSLLAPKKPPLPASPGAPAQQASHAAAPDERTHPVQDERLEEGRAKAHDVGQQEGTQAEPWPGQRQGMSMPRTQHAIVQDTRARETCPSPTRYTRQESLDCLDFLDNSSNHTRHPFGADRRGEAPREGGPGVPWTPGNTTSAASRTPCGGALSGVSGVVGRAEQDGLTSQTSYEVRGSEKVCQSVKVAKTTENSTERKEHDHNQEVAHQARQESPGAGSPKPAAQGAAQGASPTPPTPPTAPPPTVTQQGKVIHNDNSQGYQQQYPQRYPQRYTQHYAQQYTQKYPQGYPQASETNSRAGTGTPGARPLGLRPGGLPQGVPAAAARGQVSEDDGAADLDAMIDGMAGAPNGDSQPSYSRVTAEQERAEYLASMPLDPPWYRPAPGKPWGVLPEEWDGAPEAPPPRGSGPQPPAGLARGQVQTRPQVQAVPPAVSAVRTVSPPPPPAAPPPVVAATPAPAPQPSRAPSIEAPAPAQVPAAPRAPQEAVATESPTTIGPGNIPGGVVKFTTCTDVQVVEVTIDDLKPQALPPPAPVAPLPAPAAERREAVSREVETLAKSFATPPSAAVLDPQWYAGAQRYAESRAEHWRRCDDLADYVATLSARGAPCRDPGVVAELISDFAARHPKWDRSEDPKVAKAVAARLAAGWQAAAITRACEAIDWRKEEDGIARITDIQDICVSDAALEAWVGWWRKHKVVEILREHEKAHRGGDATAWSKAVEAYMIAAREVGKRSLASFCPTPREFDKLVLVWPTIDELKNALEKIDPSSCNIEELIRVIKEEIKL